MIKNNWIQYHASLKLSELIVTEELQRNIRLNRIKKIVKNFNPRSVGTLTISFRDGKYYILDGQHRAVALMQLGYKEWDCVVLEGLTVEDEGRIYKNKADSAAHNAYEKYKSDLVIKDPLTLKLKDLVESTGLQIAERKKRDALGCINDLYYCIKKDEKLLIITINLLKDNFTCEHGITGVELRGLFLFLEKAMANDIFNLNYFVSRFKSKLQGQILKLAAQTKEANYTTAHRGYALTLLHLYNFNREAKNRLSLDI